VNRWVILAAALALGGCKSLSENCNAPQTYQTAGSVSGLKVPEGLQAPSTKNALQVPPSAQQYQARKVGQKCMDAPPQYFAEPLTPPAGSKKNYGRSRWWWHP